MELFWVSVRDCEADTCEAILLNDPFQLTSLNKGQTLLFPVNVAPDAMLMLKL